MTYTEYVQVLGDLLSGDPDRVREANARLFGAVVTDANGRGPAFALADAEPAAIQG